MTPSHSASPYWYALCGDGLCFPAAPAPENGQYRRRGGVREEGGAAAAEAAAWVWRGAEERQQAAGSGEDGLTPLKHKSTQRVVHASESHRYHQSSVSHHPGRLSFFRGSSISGLKLHKKERKKAPPVTAAAAAGRFVVACRRSAPPPLLHGRRRGPSW